MIPAAEPPPLPQTLRWEGGVDGTLHLLDQTRLPQERVVLALRDEAGVAAAIRALSVRGAPAIGVAAAYGVVLGVRERRPGDAGAFARAVAASTAALAATRPTAVNLRWACARMATVAAAQPTLDALLAEARAIHREDAECCARMGRHGKELVRPGTTVLTHCNTGALATAGAGTALAVLFAAHADGVRFAVLADETRPLLQGARLTALELAAAGIPVEVIADGAAAGLMAHGAVDLVLVGADRIAANGDVANKVGTYGLALAAAAHGVPFWVVAPTSTFDLATPDGTAIPVEQRDPDEVLTCAGLRLTAPGVAARNPAFDVTPARLVTGIVTDVGRIAPVDAAAIKRALAAGR